MSTSNPSLAALSLSLPVDPTTEIQLTPSGPEFRAADGSNRPADADAWRIDAAIAAKIIQRFAGRKNPRVIDYEHQTLKDGPAPAAGWFSGLEWKEGDNGGLFATGVAWTPRAAEMLKAGEYRYISPVFTYMPGSGEILEIKMAALTNDPGLDGMKAALRSQNTEVRNQEPRLTTDLCSLTSDNCLLTKENQVELKTLLAALNLPETETEETALAAVAALKTKADAGEAKDAEIAALKAGEPAVAFDPTKHVGLEVVTALQAEIAALKADAAVVSADALIEAARDEGKAIPDALAAHLKTLPIAAMKTMLATMPAISALRGSQSAQAGISEAGRGVAPTDAENAVMKALGQTAQQFAQGKE